MERPGGVAATITVNHVLHAPGLERDLISERLATLSTGLPFGKTSPWLTWGWERRRVVFLITRCHQGCTSCRRRGQLCSEGVGLGCKRAGDKQYHGGTYTSRLPTRTSTYEGARQGGGVVLTGEWIPCAACDLAKAHCVPKTAENQASERAEQLLIDLAGGKCGCPASGKASSPRYRRRLHAVQGAEISE